MNYKLVAIDLDGTLLDPYMKISEKNLNTIREAVEKGVVVTLSTGRMFAAALPFARHLQLDVPLITCNGAAVICARTKKIYYERAISLELVLQIIGCADEFGLELSLYTVDDIFVTNKRHNSHIHREIDNAQVKVANLKEIAEQYPIIKIMFSSKDLHRHAEEIYRRLKEHVSFYFSLPWFVEIVAKGVDKGYALEKLAEKFNIQQSEIIAIGDNFNDLPMILYAGLGVAMGNAPDDLKELADFVTSSYDDDGVAHVIDQYVLKADNFQFDKR